jgi:hypothetical protein
MRVKKPAYNPVTEVLVWDGSWSVQLKQPVSQITLRNMMLERVRVSYDSMVEDGFFLSVVLPDAGQVEIHFDREDVDNMSGSIILAVSAGSLETDIIIPSYLFESGYASLTLRDCVSLSSAFSSEKMGKFLAHRAIRDAVNSGFMPLVSDCDHFGLVADDFDGLGLS